MQAEREDSAQRRRYWLGAGALLSLLLIGPLAWSIGAEFIPGDINDDGVVDILDPTALRRDLVGLGAGISQMCVATCGDGVLDPNSEDCEFADLGDGTCQMQGLLFGTLTCGAGCVFDTSGCTNTRFVDNGDGTIIDNQTGLMWEKKVGGGVCLHCVDDEYDWGDAMSDWISEVNGHTNDPDVQAGLGGHTDWRLPTIVELQTILLEPWPCGTNPCIDSIFGPTASWVYWSSTLFTNFPTGAWFIFFVDGLVLDFAENIDAHVRAVRGGHLPPCAPPTCSAEDWECGSLDNGCGGFIDCGSCVSPNNCFGGTCFPPVF